MNFNGKTWIKFYNKTTRTIYKIREIEFTFLIIDNTQVYKMDVL